jgi:hypothetical protein
MCLHIFYRGGAGVNGQSTPSSSDTINTIMARTETIVISMVEDYHKEDNCQGYFLKLDGIFIEYETRVQFVSCMAPFEVYGEND